MSSNSKEKEDKYRDLKSELKRIWSCSEVMVIFIEALGTISKNFNHWLAQINHNLNFGTLQKACLVGTAVAGYNLILSSTLPAF